MVSFNFYRAQEDWYIRIIRPRDNTVYDVTAGGMSAGPGWDASVITLTWNSVIEGYVVELPDLPPGDQYDICFYNEAVPASSDEVLYGQEHNNL